MKNKTKNLIIILTISGLIAPVLTFAVSAPTLELKADGLYSPVTISYNTSANLTWTSTNADSCTGSGAWSGGKATSGSTSTGNLTSSKTYILTCTGPGGLTTATMKVNVTGAPTLTVNKLVRNLSDGTFLLDSVSAEPNERVSFLIQVGAGTNLLEDVVVKDTLPSQVIYSGNLKIDGVSSAGNIISGINIGNVLANQTRAITFDATIAGPAQFNTGSTNLINTAMAYNDVISNSDTAKITVVKTAVLGAVTEVSTGLTNNFFLDSFFLPLVITLVIIWIFKSHIINFEEWIEKRKKEYREYQTKKILQLTIIKIKAQEFFRAIKNR